jgi:hypothetical protein
MTGAALPFIVAATFFMEYLDTTIVATRCRKWRDRSRLGRTR